MNINLSDYEERISKLCITSKLKVSASSVDIDENELNLTTNSIGLFPIVTSKLSEAFIWGGGRLTPQKVEIFQKEKAPLQVKKRSIRKRF